jgi:hypothetical protein
LYKQKRIGEKMQLKKALAAGALGALMAGSTLAFAASLSDFPAPFVSAGTPNFLVVVGASAQVSDVVGAVDIAARLGGAPVTSETITCAGASSGTVANGVRLDTANTKIRLGNALTTAKDTLSKSDLSTILAQGTVTDTSGNQYTYDQYIQLGSVPTVGFANPTSTPTTPNLVLNAGGTAVGNAWYTAKIVFQKPLAGDLTATGATTTTLDGKAIKLFGQDYTLGSGTTELTNNTVTLYGGGQDVTIPWTQGTASGAQTVTVGGKTVTVTLNGISTGSKASLNIDGSTDSYSASNYITTTSGLRIYVKTVNLYGTGAAGDVTLKVGADKLTLQNGQTVKTGTAGDTVQGTLVAITSGSTSNLISISSIAITAYPKNSDEQKIIAGSSFTDPVFASFELALSGESPSLTDSARDATTVSYSGDSYAQVGFTDYNGVQKTMTIGNIITGTPGVNMTDSTYTIHVSEADQVARNDYTIINQGGFSHLLQYTTNDMSATSPSVTFRDVISNVDYKVYLNSTYGGTTVIDGKSYFVQNTTAIGTGNVVLQRGITARTGAAAGTAIALFTPIKLKNGEELVLVRPTPITNNTYYTIPGNDSASGDNWGTTFMYNDTNANVTYLPAHTSYTIDGTNDVISATGASLTGLQSVGVVLVEERDSANNRNAVTVPITSALVTGTTYRISVSTPVFSTGAALVSTSDSYLQKGLDLYGTLASYQGTSGTGQYAVTLSYPSDQTVADVMLGGLDMAVSAGTSGQSVVKQTVTPITAPVAKLDTEVLATSADRTGKNLILVGGPCVNTLVADLATAGKFAYTCANWPGRNFGLLKVIDDAFATGKTALVVAGTTATDTRNAAQKLQSGVGLTAVAELEVTA